MLLAIGLRHAQEHLVFVDAELRGFPHGEKRGVLVVFRPDAVNQPVALEDVFLAQHLLRVLVLAIRAEDFAFQRLAVFLGLPAWGEFLCNSKPASFWGFFFGLAGGDLLRVAWI